MTTRFPLADGYTDLPPGKIAAVATTLEMRTPPPPTTDEPVAPFALRPVVAPTADWYRALFRDVGEPWLWHSRLRLTEPALLAIIHDPAVEVWALSDPVAGDMGLLELDFREPEACELAFFGVTVPFVGKGAGRQLMAQAIARAWSRPIRRFWVHTCTLDHPSALGFYIRSGFVPVKRQLEIATDPRLDGTLAPDAAPAVPRL
jgi:GNAT superfamily N-acetyltransferase